MREVIQKVIATEAEARCIVEAARTEAGRITSEAQKQAESLVALARQEARVETERIMAAALPEAECEKQGLLARATVEMESQIRFDQDTRDRAVKAVIRCVCGEHLTDGGTGHDTANG